jgi:hypothetical protein
LVLARGAAKKPRQTKSKAPRTATCPTTIFYE